MTRNLATDLRGQVRRASQHGTGPGFLKQTGAARRHRGLAGLTAICPAHTHAGTDITSAALHTVLKSAAAIGTRRGINLIEGTNVTLTVADDAGNDRVNVTIAAAAGGGSNHNLLSGTHSGHRGGVAGPGDLIAANGTPAWARLAGNATTTRKFLRQTGNGTVSRAACVGHALAGRSADAQACGGRRQLRHARPRAWRRGSDLSATGPGFLKQAAAGAAVTVAALAAGDLPTHTHTSAQISDATAAATASTVVLRDGSAGANFGYVAANNLWAYLDSHLQSVECGAFQTVGGPYENMLKYSEDFSVGDVGQERRHLHRDRQFDCGA